MQKRILVLHIGVILVFVAIISRLFYWQVIKAKDLSKQAKSQHELGQNVQAPRGNILANDGSWLSARSDAFLLYAELPNLTDSPKTIANKIAPFLFSFLLIFLLIFF